MINVEQFARIIAFRYTMDYMASGLFIERSYATHLFNHISDQWFIAGRKKTVLEKPVNIKIIQNIVLEAANFGISIQQRITKT